MIEIEQFDHVGIRVTEPDRAMDFYKLLGFELELKVDFDDVIIMKNKCGVEINLIVNGINLNDGKNILMDLPEKYPGFTHVALRVSSILDTLEHLKQNGMKITQGPVTFGRDGHVSVFLRDPDRNTLELRGRIEDEKAIPNLVFYDPSD